MAMTKKAFNVGLVLVLILVLLKLFFIDRSPFGKKNSSFSVDHDKVISKVEMTRGDEKLVIKEDDGNWTVNGIPGVSKSAVTSFLSLLTEIQIKSPVSDDTFNELIIKPGIEPVKVKVFVRHRVGRTFLVYKTESNVYGNIMKTGERAQPFIVYAPGFKNNIGSFFEMNELLWLPYIVFNERSSEIQSLEVSYKNDNGSSFRIENIYGRYILSESQGETEDVDSLKVTRYLSYYTYIPFEKWALELSREEKNKITSEVPEIVIKLSPKTGKNIYLSVWPRWNCVGGEMILDTDRVWGSLNNFENIFVMRYFDIDPILKKRSYFIKE
jgi:hypothetical protein